MGIDYEGMQEIYNSINEVIKDMMTQVKDSKGIINKLNNNDSWDGNGFDHYSDLYSDMCTNFVAFCDYMYSLNTNIMDSIGRYKEIDKKALQYLAL